MSALDLRGKIMRKCRESMATKEQFFSEQADRIGECCRALAKAFDDGARLFVMGNGGSSRKAVTRSRTSTAASWDARATRPRAA